ncbi:MAG: AAA family ATPase [Micropruina sp.]|uniref:AAA family ATPase n=1 Tax=Micropruina sp. TaxID=2737536 RepID=UPI0039E2C437
MRGFVLVGGWPGSGKTTLSRALAAALAVDYLAKDDAKEALMDALGAPHGVEESRRLGRAAVAATLRLAQGCRAAVIDSTWYPYTAPLVAALPGPFVELRCTVPVEVARRRYRSRLRDPRHLDADRSEAELWGSPVEPLGVGPLIEVDTAHHIAIDRLAERVRATLTDE